MEVRILSLEQIEFLPDEFQQASHSSITKTVRDGFHYLVWELFHNWLILTAERITNNII